ncbi:MAG: hypothetical protein ACKVVT_10580 [Dehalococcoidia bacterium]
MAEKVDHYEESDLPESQKVALRLCDSQILRPGDVPDSLRDQLHQHYTPAQLVELVLDIAKWSTQKVPVALGTDIEINPGGLARFDFNEAGKPVFGAKLP